MFCLPLLCFNHFSLKKTVPISFITLSIVALLIFTCIPHHRHEGGICMLVAAHCDEKKAVDVEESEKGARPVAGDCDADCICKAHYTEPESVVKMKHETCSVNVYPGDYFHPFPLYFLVADFLLHASESFSVEQEYGGFISPFYQSVAINRLNGLRAPPFFLA